MISPSYDKHPVYFNKFGLPLRPGSQLRYYLVGTNTPKTVYTDTACSVPAPWPQIINAESRTDTQIFVGSGDATVISYEIAEGIDPLTAVFPDDYSLDNQWVDPGLSAVSGGTSTSVVALGTIAALRANNPTGAGTVEFEVQGYYTQGDKAPKRYVWDPSSVSADNGGTIIQSTGIATGRYRLKIEGPVIDVRDFGIIPGKTDLSVNGLMSSMLGAISYGQPNPTTIYFPPGIYRVDPGSITWTTPVALDQWVRFNVASAGTFTMDFASRWDIKAQFALQDSSSTGTFNPVFSYQDAKLEVNLRWWGAASSGNYDTGEGNALRTASSYVDHLHSIVIDEPYLIDYTLGGTFTCSVPIVFRHSGILKNGQLAYSVILSDVTNERTDGAACLDYTGSGSICIASGYPIKTSWFGANQAYDAGAGLAHLSLTSTRGTRVIMDKDCWITNQVTAFTETSFQHLTWVPQGGVLHIDGDDSVIHLGSVGYTESRIFDAAPGALSVSSGVISPMMWYDRSTNNDEAFRAALYSLLHARFDCTMDLGGITWTPTNQVQSTSSYNKSRTIRNGSVSSSMAYPVIDMASGQTFRLSTEKVLYNGASPWVSSSVGSSVINLYTKDSALSSGSKPVFSQGGAIHNLYVDRSNLSSANMINGTFAVVALTDSYLTGGLAIQAASVKIKGCEANNYSLSVTNWYIRSSSANITGNEFIGVNLGMLPHTVASYPVITGNITGNTFKVLNQTYGWAIVYANADVANTRLNGFTVVGNTWYTENLTTAGQTKMIQAVTTDSGSFFLDGNAHRCKVASNSGNECGSLYSNSSILITSTVNQHTFTSWSGGIPGPITVALPPSAFWIPGATTSAQGVANGMVTSDGTEYMALDCVSGAAAGYMDIRLSGEVTSGAGSNPNVVAASYTLYGVGG